MSIRKISIILILMCVGLSIAQVPDTTEIPYTGVPQANIIKQTIEADTLADGTNKDMVYLLDRGGIYTFGAKVYTNGGHVQVIGKEEPADMQPAFLVADFDESGVEINRDFFETSGDFTIKNIAWTSVGPDGIESISGNLVKNMKDETNHVFENIFGQYGEYWFRDDGARGSLQANNIIHINAGGNYAIKNEHMGSTVKNLTGLNLRKAAPRGGNFMFGEAVTDHWTLIFSIWGPTQWGEAHNIVYKNSVYYDQMMRVDNLEKLKTRPNGVQDCVFQWAKLDSAHIAGYVAEGVMTDSSDRKITLENYCIYHSDCQRNFYDADDSLFMTLYIRPSMLTDYINNPGYPLITMSNIVEEDPQFKDLPMDCSYQLSYIASMLDGDAAPASFAYLDIDGDSDPLTLPWPLENYMDLQVQNPNIVKSGTDGEDFGDLRWSGSTGIENNASHIKSKTFELSQNYPNPFNPTTTITYTLNKAADVKLSVLNILGQQISTLVNENVAAGSHRIVWDGTNSVGNKVESGVYFYKLETENFSQTRKMLLVK